MKRKDETVSFLKRLAELVSWFALWAGLPAALLYPIALWMERRTQFSGEAIAQSYLVAVSVLFFPSAYLVDFLYRRFIRDRHTSRSPDAQE
jgi:predicted PurR-regulated permease PerM